MLESEQMTEEIAANAVKRTISLWIAAWLQRVKKSLSKAAREQRDNAGRREAQSL